MDIWDTLYEKAKKQYHPEEVSPFVYAHHVACALEAENGEIYTGFCIESCSGVLNLCAERAGSFSISWMKIMRTLKSWMILNIEKRSL